MTNTFSPSGCLSVRLNAVIENYRICQRLSGATVAAVVKADGYGLGAIPIARVLHEAGCDTFFVARLEEGITLRHALPDVRIFVLDGCPSETAPALIAHNLTPILNSLGQVDTWRGAARGQRARLEAAIHVDTGINRLGLSTDELATLSAEANDRLKNTNVVLIMSHLACSEDPSAQMNCAQLARFRAALAMLPPAPASLSPSGGVCLGPEYASIWCVGIALYGGNPPS